MIGLFQVLALVLSVFATRVNADNLARRDKNLPARLPYVFPAPGTSAVSNEPRVVLLSPDTQLQLADHIRSRRTNGTLLALDGMLLNAPGMAEGEDSLFGNIRDNNSLPATMRELFILRTAVINSSSYQWLQHFLVGVSAGLTTPQLEAVRNPTPTALQLLALTPALRAALAFADESTKSIKVSQATFNNLRQFLNNQQMVEATMTVAGYNAISRFVVGLDVDGMANVALPSVNASFTTSD
ncbi:hypothetical protein EXIGLDRAFT_627288 [Exidia glandulosa HHB12029]|uniref:Carboxymuconolactone decarboxylase-like domain-containing protein n=1 Tax=Exidia glandulosa HHB12029 TaxID=1314781 RepID=A0A165CD59_EXIGL|nr:hypothetical protein EXIGLDRAFT_627288 [Exidia glandulosa HHB12029]